MIQYDSLRDLIDIKVDNNKTLLHELVEMFSKQTPDRLGEIDKAIKQNNKVQVSRTAHTLKASCSYLGANEMAQLCSQLEKIGHEQDGMTNFQQAQVYLSALEESYEDSLNELTEYLKVVVH